MIVEPKVKGFICTTAHPTGCAESVRRQINYVKQQKQIRSEEVGAGDEGIFKPKNALIIGSSTGYGLASRIAVAYGYGAGTIGVAYEKESKPPKRTASAGWYNTIAFDEQAGADGLYAKSFNGDGFSDEMKTQVIDAIKEDMGQVDLVVYSLAAPRRTIKTGETAEDGTPVTKAVSSVLKTVGREYTNRTLDLKTNEIHDVTVPVATVEEIADTITVMGGEDWAEWIKQLSEAGVLADGAVTLAYSYIGPTMTHPIYKDGSIGQAKKDLKNTADSLCREYKSQGVRAYISVNKALVTQSSAAIPIVPLYISLLYKVMKNKGVHEGCIEQMERLFLSKLPARETDTDGYIRLDDWEMREDVQSDVARAWDAVTTENLGEYADIDGYWQDFYEMFGFRIDGVDYEADVEI